MILNTDKKGFTLLELIIVITILTIIAAGVSLSLNNARRRSDLDSSATVIVSSLRSTQSKALDGSDSKNWGVSFDSANGKSSVITDDGIQKIVIEENYLPASIKLNAASLASGCNEIIFSKPRGETTQDCAIRIEDAMDPNLYRDIAVKTTGFVGLNP